MQEVKRPKKPLIYFQRVPLLLSARLCHYKPDFRNHHRNTQNLLTQMFLCLLAHCHR